jgi:hypothetical protein
MSSKYTVAALVAILGVLALAPAGTPAEGETIWVEDVNINPDPAVVNETVTISCILTDDTNVSKLFLYICAGGLCYPPVEMTNTEGSIWSADTDLVTTIEEYQAYVQVQFDNATFWSSEYIHFTPLAPSTDLEVESLTLGADEVKVDEKVDVYCNITDDTDIVLVQVMACQGDVCFTPVTMEKLANGTYHAEIGPFDSTDEVKYNVTAKYSNDNLAWTVDVKFTPVESGGGDGDDDDDGVIPTLGAVAVLAALAGLAVTRRGKKA